MKLAGIKPGDVVRVGSDYHCFVLERSRGELRVRGICAGETRVPRTVKARDVTKHWAQR